jgi:hypothetical protein
MTTIVATKKGIYSDTLCSYSVPFKVDKVVEIGKSLFGGAGDLDDICKFFEWRRKGGKKADAPTIEDGVDILEVCADGIFIWGKKLVRLKIDQDVYAVGSGSQYATGAMEAGLPPDKAIEVAAKYDSQTGLPIKFVRLKKVG